MRQSGNDSEASSCPLALWSSVETVTFKDLKTWNCPLRKAVIPTRSKFHQQKRSPRSPQASPSPAHGLREPVTRWLHAVPRPQPATSIAQLPLSGLLASSLHFVYCAALHNLEVIYYFPLCGPSATPKPFLYAGSHA